MQVGYPRHAYCDNEVNCLDSEINEPKPPSRLDDFSPLDHVVALSNQFQLWNCQR
jgi:hypothetical protein